MPVDRLIVSMERLRKRGGKREALMIGRQLTKSLPASGKAHRYLVRTLLTDPIEPADLLEARATAESMVMLWDDPNVSDQYISVIIAQHTFGLDTPDIFESVTVFFRAAPERRVRAMRRLVNYLIDANDNALAQAILVELARDVAGVNPTTLVHETLLRTGLSDTARRLEERVAEEPWAAGEVVPLLAAARESRIGSRRTALEMIEQLKPHRTRRYSLAYCTELWGQGEPMRLLRYLDSTVHNLLVVEEAGFRFDALWVVGEVDEAESVIREAATEDFTDLRVVRRLLVCFGSSEATAAAFVDELDEMRDEAFGGSGNLDVASSVWFELNDIDSILAIESHANHIDRLGTIGTYNLGRAHYVRRDFDRANELFESLEGSIRHWEAAKLQSRMLLESGRPEEALAHRDRYPRLGDPLDEVRFFSLLHLGRPEEAFASYLDQNDRQRLFREFGESAETSDFANVDDRFVIAQNGPGDDIQTFSTLSHLAQLSGSLSATCDPRLYSLMSRSLPEVTFFPVERTSGRAWPGMFRQGHEPRSSGEFYDLLTAATAERAHAASSVVLGRSLPQLTCQPDAARPYAPYLIPDDDLVAEMVDRFAHLSNPTGLAWRSEVAGPMRDIHYLTAETMRPFAALDRDYVCLQHDITEAERRVLIDIFGDRIFWLSDINLRDDFEATAATVSACTAVAGVLTTSVELAAALGTPTTLLTPNTFGAWRAQAGNQDYWFSAAVVATSDDHRNPLEAVHRAVDILRSRDHVDGSSESSRAASAD